MAKRFNSLKTKLTEKLCGKKLILYPLSLLKSLNIPTTIVIGFQSDQIKKTVEQKYPALFSYVEQSKQDGTAHAVQLTQPIWHQKNILIMKADIPLLPAEPIEKLYKKHMETNAALSFLYAHNNDPSGSSYDKLLKTEDGFCIKTTAELKEEAGDDSCCIDGGVYLISKSFLEQYINQIERKTQTNEYHLSDLVAIAHKKKRLVNALSVPFDQIRGISTFQELWAAEQIKRAELIKYWMEQGVRFSAAQTVHMDLDTKIGAGSFIGCSAHLTQGTVIGNNCTIGPFSILKNTVLGDNVRIEPHTILHNTKVGNECIIGPFAHLQEKTVIGNNCQIGNFVELKRSTIQDRTKAKHLAYLGDAHIGSGVNIGAGSITCNYDGKEKHITTINDNAFIGTNTSIVAPVIIGYGAFTAAGSVITNDVPKDALAIARAQQVNKEGYARKLRGKEEISSNKNNQESKPSFLFMGAVKTPTNPTNK
jgi:bifunctional UDP-N-acetylglucosamine pyrophosphorylase/glucosamine-1-phosphate N-acetyltransferase